MCIRRAEPRDVCRIAEILVFNNRIYFFPIFQNESYSFGEMQVVNVADEYLSNETLLKETFVFDDGVVRGLIRIQGHEVKKLYVDSFFQGQGIGRKLLDFAVKEFNADFYGRLKKILER